MNFLIILCSFVCQKTHQGQKFAYKNGCIYSTELAKKNTHTQKRHKCFTFPQNYKHFYCIS